MKQILCTELSSESTSSKKKTFKNNFRNSDVFVNSILSVFWYSFTLTPVQFICLIGTLLLNKDTKSAFWMFWNYFSTFCFWKHYSNTYFSIFSQMQFIHWTFIILNTQSHGSRVSHIHICSSLFYHFMSRIIMHIVGLSFVCHCHTLNYLQIQKINFWGCRKIVIE